MALIHIGGKSYELVHENRNGWNPEAFRDRYSEVLERYDFIVGDWGYSQLRLKGFFRDTHSKATKDSLYSGMPDYINEYCNFGCAYFILEKKESSKKEPEDFDFDAEEPKPRVDARTYRMPESAGRSETGQLDETAAGKEASAPAQERPARGGHRHDNGNRNHNNSQRENGKTDNGHRSGGEGQQRGERGERSEQQRKPYRGNDHRNKKHARSGTAASEAAASAETQSNQRTNKDAGRS